MEREALKTYFLQVDDLHRLYIEEWGSPQGTPIVFLHGGPGGAISKKCLDFFDLDRQHVILFDQRGCGKSEPFLELKNNTIQYAVEDMETIRRYIGLDRWAVFGGSYGSTLALAYAIAHPQRVTHLVLRGIFLGRKEDIDWLYQEGAGAFYPAEFAAYQSHISAAKQSDLVGAYYELLRHRDAVVRNAASMAWANWESGIVNHIPKPPESQLQPWHQSLALLECHYFVNHMFWEKDSYILDNAHRLAEIPMDIVHGRYDVDCRPIGAYLLAKACPQARLHIVEAAGHSPYDPPMLQQLQEIIQKIV